jgi:hypothetical protein
MKYQPSGRRNDQKCGRVLTRNRPWGLHHEEDYELLGFWTLYKTPTLLGPLERAYFNHWSSEDLRTETDPVYETLCFLVSRILDDGESNSDYDIL